MHRAVRYLFNHVFKNWIWIIPGIECAVKARNTITYVDNEIDDAVVRAFSRGSEPAFRKIYDRYAPAIYRVAQRYFHSSILAEELIEELFSTLWRERGLYTDAVQLRLRLFTMARDLAIQYLEKTTADVLSATQSHTSSSEKSPVGENSRPVG